ncbi:MAG TPA: hypothetical protein VMC06_12780 [Opitutaceae bacterium]|nr:hypothetical protein [Opitutaceae bacterium]
MIRSTKSLRDIAGTSFTKATAAYCRIEMRPVVSRWNQHTDTGSLAKTSA